MDKQQPARTAFDEQAALAELERLQRAIEDARHARQEKVDAFGEFVRSFRKPGSARDAAAPPLGRTGGPRENPLLQGHGRDPHEVVPLPTPVPRAQMPAVVPQAKPPIPAPGPAHPALAQERALAAEHAPVVSVPGAGEAPPPPAAATARSGRRGARAGRVLGGAAVLIAAGVAVAKLTRGTPDATSQPVAPANPRPAATTPAAPPADAAPAAIPPAATATPPETPATALTPSGIEAELVALRGVWVRVTVDGERRIERELDEGARVPIRGDRAITIRAGDAGAVRVTIDGAEQPRFGPDGQVVTRTFTARRAPQR